MSDENINPASAPPAVTPAVTPDAAPAPAVAPAVTPAADPGIIADAVAAVEAVPQEIIDAVHAALLDPVKTAWAGLKNGDLEHHVFAKMRAFLGL